MNTRVIDAYDTIKIHAAIHLWQGNPLCYIRLASIGRAARECLATVITNANVTSSSARDSWSCSEYFIKLNLV